MTPCTARHVWSAWTTAPQALPTGMPYVEESVVFVFVRECCLCGLQEEQQ